MSPPVLLRRRMRVHQTVMPASTMAKIRAPTASGPPPCWEQHVDRARAGPSLPGKRNAERAGSRPRVHAGAAMQSIRSSRGGVGTVPYKTPAGSPRLAEGPIDRRDVVALGCFGAGGMPAPGLNAPPQV